MPPTIAGVTGAPGGPTRRPGAVPFVLAFAVDSSELDFSQQSATLMIITYTALTIALTLLLTPFFAYLSLITLMALIGPTQKARPVASPASPPRFLFVIPAHDEESTIETTVRSCRAVDYPADRFSVVVIADNCTDATALVARRAGAVVVERIDALKRSKGAALAFLFARLADGSFEREGDAVVVVDADSSVDPWILNAFAESLGAGYDWIQCYDTVRNCDTSWRARLMTYAFSLINGVWLVGHERLGLGAALKGNGMCLSVRGLDRVAWRAAGLVEDAEQSWRLRLLGERIAFQPAARVFAEMLDRGGPAAAGQRRRWESGRRELRGEFFGPLRRSRRLGPYRKLMHLLELFFPSLVVLAGGLVIGAGIHAAAWLEPQWIPVSRSLLPIHGAMALTLAGYALSPFHVMGLPLRLIRCLALVPLYALWKLVVILGKSPTEWVRTQRESHARREPQPRAS